MDLYILKVPKSIYKIAAEEIISDLQSTYNIKVIDLEKFTLAHSPENRYIKFTLDNEEDHMKLVSLRDIHIFHAILPVRPKHGDVLKSTSSTSMDSSHSSGYDLSSGNICDDSISISKSKPFCHASIPDLSSRSVLEDSTSIPITRSSRLDMRSSSIWEDSTSSSTLNHMPFSNAGRSAVNPSSIWEDSTSSSTFNSTSFNKVHEHALSSSNAWRNSTSSSLFNSMPFRHADRPALNPSSFWEDSTSSSRFKSFSSNHTSGHVHNSKNIWEDSAAPSTFNSTFSSDASRPVFSSNIALDGISHGQLSTSHHLAQNPLNTLHHPRHREHKLPMSIGKRNMEKLQCAKMICETLSNGINNPEAFVNYFNETIVNMGYSRIPVPKNVIEIASKNLKAKSNNSCKSVTASYTV
ncbi:unnamed protein product [Meganyctiphanes norvegica]|uniref:Uncharacterized protein n=1 Tax=Meganyctiphanes norvegica TaxID=48144 RepID=A0AAV2QA95_MEGNR